MGNHKQAAGSAREVFLEPLDHFEVEVVGRLVEYHQVGLLDEHRCKGHAFFLPSRQFLYRLVETRYLQFCKHLLGTVLVIPCTKAVHLLGEALQLLFIARLQSLFVAGNHLCNSAIALQAGINNRETGREIGFLFKIPHSYATAHGYLAIVARFFPCYNFEQRALSFSVPRNEADALALLHGKGYTAKKHQIAEPLRHSIYLQIYCHKSSFCYECKYTIFMRTISYLCKK